MMGLILARAAGVKTIITVFVCQKKLQFVTGKHRVDFCINYKRHPNWAEEVLKITCGKGADHIRKNGESGTIKQSIQATRGGVTTIIGFLAAVNYSRMADVASLVLGRACVVRRVDAARPKCCNML
jgi:NADPH:quinone reductase-like Zn-dependent oxidoreductase